MQENKNKIWNSLKLVLLAYFLDYVGELVIGRYLILHSDSSVHFSLEVFAQMETAVSIIISA